MPGTILRTDVNTCPTSPLHLHPLLLSNMSGWLILDKMSFINSGFCMLLGHVPFNFLFYSCVCVDTYLFICTPHAYSTCGGQKRELDSLKLVTRNCELPSVDAGNRTQVL